MAKHKVSFKTKGGASISFMATKRAKCATQKSENCNSKKRYTHASGCGREATLERHGYRSCKPVGKK